MTLLTPGSQLAIAFYQPMELLDAEDQPTQEIANKGAEASGTPFVSFFSEQEVRALAEEAGLKDIRTVSTKDLIAHYFKDRSDGLLPASGEVYLVAGG